MTEAHTSRDWKRSLVIVVGVAATLALVIGFLLTRSASTQDPDIALIERYADAWFGGDHATALAILGFDPAGSQPAIEWSRYEGAIAANANLDCEPRDNSPDVFDCAVSYSNSLYEAIGASPATQQWSGRVDGKNIEVLDYQPNPGAVEASWSEWVGTALPPGASPCDPFRPPTEDCALFKLYHLDEWATWHLSRES